MHLEISPGTSLRRLRKIARALACRWKCPVNFTFEGGIIRENGPVVSPLDEARCRSKHGSYRRHSWDRKTGACKRCCKARNPKAKPLRRDAA